MSKRGLIRRLIYQGLSDGEIAERLGATKGYVNNVRHDKSSHSPAIHVRMTYTPWTIDPSGVLSREIRGE